MQNDNFIEMNVSFFNAIIFFTLLFSSSARALEPAPSEVVNRIELFVFTCIGSSRISGIRPSDPKSVVTLSLFRDVDIELLPASDSAIAIMPEHIRKYVEKLPRRAITILVKEGTKVRTGPGDRECIVLEDANFTAPFLVNINSFNNFQFRNGCICFGKDGVSFQENTEVRLNASDHFIYQKGKWWRILQKAGRTAIKEGNLNKPLVSSKDYKSNHKPISNSPKEKQVVITVKSGNTFSGILLEERDNGYLLKVNEGNYFIVKSDVAHITLKNQMVSNSKSSIDTESVSNKNASDKADYGARYGSGFGGGPGGVDDLIGSLMGGDAGGLGLKKRGSLKIAAPQFTKGDSLTGARSKASIMRVVMQNLAALRYEYNQRLRDKPGLKGRITIKFAINEFGKVIFSKVENSTVNDPVFEKIIAEKIRRWVFEKIDKPGDVTEVVYPFIFSQ